MSRITQQRWEQNMKSRMASEDKRDQLIARASEARRHQGDIEGRQRAVQLQRQNTAARNAAQTMFEEKLDSAENHRLDQNRDHDQAEALASVMAGKKREQDRWEMEISRICEKDPSLKELQGQLNAAYMNQERAAQQTEKNYLTHLEKDRIMQIDQQMEEDRQAALRAMSGKDGLRLANNRKAQAVLDKQIEQKTRAAIEDGRRQFMEDKKMVDDIVNKVHAEDEKTSRERRDKEEATRKFIHNFQLEQQVRSRRGGDVECVCVCVCVAGEGREPRREV